MNELNHDRIKLLLAMNAPIVFTAFANTKFENAAYTTSMELAKKIISFYYHYFKYNNRNSKETTVYLIAKIHGKEYFFNFTMENFISSMGIKQNNVYFANAFSHFILGIPESKIEKIHFTNCFM